MNKSIGKSELEENRGPGCYKVNEINISKKDKVLSYGQDTSKRSNITIKEQGAHGPGYYKVESI